MRPTPARRRALLALFAALLCGCAKEEPGRVVDLWHQMRPEDRDILVARVADFESENDFKIKVRLIYKETEELRSGMVAAMLAGEGPEIMYGPSDAVALYQAMGALADMSPPEKTDGVDDFERLTTKELKEFDSRCIVYLPARDDPQREELVFLGDRYGNHLALIYNQDFVLEAPKTIEELVDAAEKSVKELDGDGRKARARYGLVWNYVEPYFVVPFFTGFGAWVFEDQPTADGQWTPALDTPQMIRSLEFLADMRRRENLLSRSADYESAQAQFLGGQAAMIIDGDWSWQKYLSADGVDAVVVPLPDVAETGLPMAPMASPKGYSLTAFAEGQEAEDAMALIRFLTNKETQHRFLEEQKILPSLLALRDDPLVTDDDVMAVSLLQAKRARVMPVAVELRAVWDGMRAPYQSLMNGQIDAQAAAELMQRNALDRIAAMKPAPPGRFAKTAAYALAAALTLGLVAWQRRNIAAFVRNVRSDRLAYAMVLPSIALIFLTVLYPLAYNVVLSFSNMSLTNLRDSEVVGLDNYATLAVGRNASQFWGIFLKTVFWTAINVAFHVTIGVLLAVTLNGPVRGKSIYRVLLIIPWAVPAYITALTWRGMFDYEFGVVNLAIKALGRFNQWLPEFLQLEPVNWLGEAGPAFAACIIANVWLGFPFMMVIALGGLQGIPSELYEAARIDRASRWQQFRQITLPMLRPVLAPAVTLGTVWTFNNLNVVWLVSNTGEPADQTHILVSYVYKAVFNAYQYGYGAALSMVIFGILLTFSLLFLGRTRATEAAY
jgi:arabinogalactan oligomer / maltooligosaccharide transport system permease protein